MTRAEKHALIAEKIEGWMDIQYTETGYEGVTSKRADGLWEFAPIPEYSADLNLIARAEKRIAEMGLWEKHEECLNCMMPVCDSQAELRWHMATAPAEARVDAIVELIESGALERAL